MNLNERQPTGFIDREAARTVKAAKAALIDEQPFFGSLCLRLVSSENRDIDAIAGDGVTLQYNPDWIKETDSRQIKFAVARIVTALVLKHHLRREDRDADIWQQASFEACLDVLADAGYSAKSENFSGMSVEKIYDELYEEKEDEQDENNSAGGYDNSNGEVLDSPVESAEEKAESDEEWGEAAVQAGNYEKSCGKNDGVGSAFLSGIQEAKRVDWKVQLARYMTKSSKNDYSWSRPNRRHIHNGLYLPAMHSDNGKGKVAFCIDTSGSMDVEALESSWAEIKEISKAVAIDEIIVIQCDKEVRSVEKFNAHDVPDSLDIVGRGGTLFTPAFERIHELNLNPDLCVYLTDNGIFSHRATSGYGARPRFPVVWLNYGDYYRNSMEMQKAGMSDAYSLAEVPWGDVIYMEGEG